jgi:invasion protein IalB
MTHLIKTLPFVILATLATPVWAQSTEGDAAAEEEAAEGTPDPLALSMGDEENADGTPQPGAIYIDSKHGDWELRCVKAPEGQTDPCQLYQLLRGPDNNPVAEINVFPVGGEGQPAAGATIVTPLETLLTQQLGLSVDGGAVRKYPFSWCSQVGCFSRVGLTADDIAAFKRGNNAAAIIVPVAAPDQTIKLNISLSGFTAGFAAAEAKKPE